MHGMLNKRIQNTHISQHVQHQILNTPQLTFYVQNCFVKSTCMAWKSYVPHFALMFKDVLPIPYFTNTAHTLCWLLFKDQSGAARPFRCKGTPFSAAAANCSIQTSAKTLFWSMLHCFCLYQVLRNIVMAKTLIHFHLNLFQGH